MAHLEHARYPEALVQLRATEPHCCGSPQDLVHYSLYRGLAELALGNAEEARRWLLAARRSQPLAPRALTREERGRLESAWRSLGLMPGQE